MQEDLESSSTQNKHDCGQVKLPAYTKDLDSKTPDRLKERSKQNFYEGIFDGQQAEFGQIPWHVRRRTYHIVTFIERETLQPS